MTSRHRHTPILSLLLTGIFLGTFATTILAQAPLRSRPADRKTTIEANKIEVNLTEETLQNVGERFKLWERSQEVLKARNELRAAKGITIEQIVAYDQLKSNNDGLIVHFSSDKALPIFIKGTALVSDEVNNSVTSEESAYRFLEVYKELLRIQSPRDEFAVMETIQGANGHLHIKMSQQWQGHPIWGKEIIVHFNALGAVDMFTGRYTETPDLDLATFKIAAASAEAIAASDAGILGKEHQHNPLAAALLPHDRTSSRAIFAEDNVVRPVFVVELHPNLTDRMRYFIDAENGTILRKYNASCSDGPEKAQATDLQGTQRTIDTYLQSGVYYLIDATRPMFDATLSSFPNNPVGAIWTIDAKNSDLASLSHVSSNDNTWADASSVSAHYNAAQTYEYFRTVHSRNSIDNEGSTVVSVVNVTDGGQDMPNAFWNGQFISYGNGGSGFEAFAKALDIAAHEMAHGVTEKSANLEYLKQSGALNESFSDIFGSMVDRDDWLIGEDITPTNSNFPTGAIRSMEDPHNGGSQGSPSWQPSHMNEYLDLPANQDNGGVHINSGIPNHVAYLVANSLGKDQMETIMYNALTTKLTRQSQFIDFRLAIIQAAQELYGPNAGNACAQACDQVGILDGSGSDDPDDQFPIEATDKMLFYSGDPNDPYYLWTVTYPGTNPNDYTSLSATPPISKPTVTDDGNYALFIDYERNIRIVNLDPANFNEQILDDSGIWRQVAVSRDGNRLALVTGDNSNEIHVFDLEPATPTVQTFIVTTPDYSELGVPNTALYADALDFSSDNETLIYDCLNAISIDGYQYKYWDINLMQVWDLEAGDFGSGSSERIFSQDPRFDLGYPSFSKNSPYIFTFDVYDKYTARAYVFAADIHKQVFAAVTEVETTPTTPNYNGDDTMISFAMFPPDGPFAGSVVIYNQEVAADKLTPVGDAAIFLPDASEPVWYRQGQRPVSVESPQLSTDGFNLAQNFPNPFNPGTTIEFTIPYRTHATLTIYDRMGRVVRTISDGILEPGTHTVRWDGRNSSNVLLPSGLYFYRLIAGETQISRSMILTK